VPVGRRRSSMRPSSLTGRMPETRSAFILEAARMVSG
jgi:hypothetical protein